MENSITQLLKLFYLTGIVGYGAYLVTRFLLKPERISDFVVVFFASFIIFQYGITLLLGVLRLMSANELMIILSLTLVVLLVIRLKFLSAEMLPLLRFSHNCDKSSIISKIVYYFFTVTFLFIMVVIFRDSILYPPLFYDPLYHYLPTVVSWVQDGGIGVWSESNPAAKFFPNGCYIITYWIMNILRGDYLLGVIQPVLLIMSALTLYWLGIKAGYQRIVSICLSVGLFTLPLLLKLGIEDNNDFFTVYIFFVSIYFLFSYRDSLNKWYLFLSGAAVGIFAGTKYSGIFWFFVIALIAGLILFSLRKSGVKFMSSFIIWFFGVALFGGYWYIRNIILTGNFLFPGKVNIFGIKLYTDNSLYNQITESQEFMSDFSFIKHPYRFNDLSEYFPVLGLVYFFIGIGVLVSLCYILINIKKIKRFMIDGDNKFILSSAGLLSFLLAIGIPDAARLGGTVRHIFPAIILIVFSLGGFIKNKWVVSDFVIVFTTQVIYSIYSYTGLAPYLIIVSLISSILIFIVQKHISNLINIFFRLRFCYVVPISLVFLYLLFYNLKPLVDSRKFDKNSGKMARFDEILESMWPSLVEGWEWIDSNTNFNTIGFYDKSYTYPLINKRLTNNIKSIRVSSANGNDAFLAEKEFLSLIKNKNIDYLFLQEGHTFDNEACVKVRLHKFPEDCLKYIQNNPSLFTEVFRNESILIYKVNK